MDIYQLHGTMMELTPHQIKLVQALYDSGSVWLSRSHVAKAIGKKRLTPYDINCLKLLNDRGLIEMTTRETNAPGSDFAYIYTMPDHVAVLIQEWAEKRDDLMNPPRRKPVDIASLNTEH